MRKIKHLKIIQTCTDEYSKWSLAWQAPTFWLNSALIGIFTLRVQAVHIADESKLQLI